MKKYKKGYMDGYKPLFEVYTNKEGFYCIHYSRNFLSWEDICDCLLGVIRNAYHYNVEYFNNLHDTAKPSDRKKLNKK